MAQFKSKKQRKKVMKLVKQHDMNMKFANREIQSKKGTMSREQLDLHIDKNQPYPKNTQKT